MKISLNQQPPDILPSQPILPSIQTAIVEAFRYQHIKVLQPDEITETSIFGTPIFMPLTFDAIPASKGIAGVAKLYIPCVICTVSFSKHIVSTVVQSAIADGEFNEHINFGSYQISIKGLLSNDDDRYPMDKVYHLANICKAPVAISITQPILNKIGIYDIIITDGAPVLDGGGKQNLQPFAINAKSDKPYQLILKSEADAKRNG